MTDNEPTGIRNPSTDLGDGGETLKQVHSLALVLSSSDQCEDSTRDTAVVMLGLIEKAYAELAATTAFAWSKARA